MRRDTLKKMNTELKDVVHYTLDIHGETHKMNDYIGEQIKIEWNGEVICSCGKMMKKFYRSGFCYKCYWESPFASQSIFKPELCTAHLDIEERDLEWEKKFQIAPHYVYLANSSALKVGITRGNQLPTRWCDQGASQGLPIFRVRNRLLSGLVETLFKKTLADKTNWRAMLKGEAAAIDLIAIRDELYCEYEQGLNEIELEHGPGAISHLPDAEVVELEYPVLEYPTKVSSLNFDKTAEIEGKLMGIKGQYLLLDCGVINLRKFTSYHIEFSY